MKTRALLATVLVAGVLAPAGAAHATISTVSGPLSLISPPPVVTSLADQTLAFAWNEKQNVTLASPIAVDITTTGTYQLKSDLTPGTIPAGAVVDSHYFHHKRVSSSAAIVTATMTFPSDVIGITVTATHDDSSNVLGSPGTVYPSGDPNHGLEFGTLPTDDVVMAPDLRTVTIKSDAANIGDDVRIITRHNQPPTAAAGGPYSGVEGSPVTLNGLASDPDNDPLTISWSFSVTAATGTTCTTSNTATLSPTITCNDDATIVATLSANDASHPAVLSTAQIAIANVAPVLAPLTVPNTLVALTSPVNVSSTFSDAGTHDTHTASVDWGDTTSSAASITESNGAGSASASHTYSMRGHYTITVTLRDDDGGLATGTAQVDVNGPPTADAGGPYTGSEGTPTGLVGTAVDPENDPLTTTWTFTPTAQDPGTTCTSTGTSTLAPTITCDDDAVVSARLSASDNINPPAISDTTVTINNVAPVLGSATQNAGAHVVGAGVTVTAPFSDAGTHDTHTATVSWGDLTTSNGAIAEANGSGTLSATHAYAQPGVYTVSIVLSDDNGGTDTTSIEVRVNTPPTVDAGGPYVGTEGSQMTLHATAVDVDGDPLTYSWTFTWTGDPGTQCTATGADTLTPIVNCNDDVVVTAKLSVDDGVNAPVDETTLLTVGNVAPTLGTIVPSAPFVPTGGTFSISSVFSDPGSNDTHTATIDWGDSTTSAATVSELNGAGTVTGSHAYTAAGTYTVTVVLSDDNGATAVGTTQAVVNGPPTVNAGAPYSTVEGSPLTLAGTAHDPEGDALTKSWSISWTGDPGTGCTLTNPTSLTPTITCNDDAVVTAVLTVSDGINAPVSSTATITVDNASPSVDSVSLPTSPIPVGSPVSLSASFSEPGANDTHTATIDWGDSSTTTGTVTESAGAGTVSDTHVYATHGTYTVTVTVTDDNNGHDSLSGTVAVNGAPTVGAGGPYDTNEGSPVTLFGTATDPEGDPLTISWTHTVSSSDPGTTCSFTGTSTLTPDLVCDDDAVVSVTLHASDGVNTTITDTTTVTVHNVAPVVAPPTVSANPVALGGTVSLHTTFTDGGTNDTHAATIDWGDATTTAGTVSETAGAGSVSGSHSYGAPGTYHVSVTVTDDNGGTSTVSIDVVVNGPPTVNSGGPYYGVEGAPLTLGANATDPEGDPLTISWTRTIVLADPGAVCTFTGTSTLTPTLTCTDNALLNVTITADDGLNAPVSDTTTVTILNEAPVVSTPTLAPNPAVIGGPVTLSAAFTDSGVNDTHVASIDWGDATTTGGTVTETHGSGTVTKSHTYSVSGTYTVTVKVNDNDGGIGTASAQVVVTGSPSADAAGPYSGFEGSPVTLHGTATNPGGGPLGTTWSITWTGSPGTVCSLTGSTSLTPSVTCNDDAVVSAKLTVTDGVNTPATSTALVNIANVAPVINSITLPVTPSQVNTAIALQATFSDAGTNDTHTATIDWDDASSSAGTVTEANGAGAVAASHAYAAAGTYTVTVTVRDDDNGTTTATASSYVVVYDPSAGFVTGGGWISSPSGAYTPTNPSNAGLVGQANFGFVSKYLPNGTTPSGNTEFHLKSANLNFHATGMAWLVVTDTDTKAYYAGTGTVNGTSGYSFLVSVIDNGNHGTDLFRIKVSNTSTGAVVYDNQFGAADSDSATQQISNGSIVIHS